ncbi:MAG: response regulator [Rhodopseudomonas palustris]|nr:response regulator [Rhodopseudomonas palustris]
MVETLKPEVVIMDITLPDISGIEATRRIKEAHPGVAVVALTIHEDQQYFFEMLQAWRFGLCAQARRAGRPDHSDPRGAPREMYIYPSLAKLLVGDFLSRSAEDGAKEAMDELTPREGRSCPCWLTERPTMKLQTF